MNPYPIEALEARRLLASDPSLAGVTFTGTLLAIQGTDDAEFLYDGPVTVDLDAVPLIDRMLTVGDDGQVRLRDKVSPSLRSVYDEAVAEAGPFGDFFEDAVNDALGDASFGRDEIFDYVDLRYRKFNGNVAQVRTEIDLPDVVKDVADLDDVGGFVDLSLTGRNAGRIDIYDVDREYGIVVGFTLAGGRLSDARGFPATAQDVIVSNPLGESLFVNAAGNVELRGTGEADLIGVSRKPDGRIFVTLNDATAKLDGDLNGFEIRAGGGNDDVYYELDDVDSRIYLGGGNDRLFSGDANDLIDAGEGDDYVFAGGGNDSANGKAGRDTLTGGAGRNELFGDAGDDLLLGSGNRDTLYGGDGDDRLYGGNNDDVLYGEGGVDRLFAGSGDDLLDGGSSNDKLYAGPGNDTLVGGRGRDLFHGGDGDDLALLDDEDDTSPDFLAEVERTV